MNKITKLLFATGIVLAMTLTFSCSSDGNSETTYWISQYGIVINPYYLTLASQYEQYENPSYDDLKYILSEVRKIGTFIRSDGGISEQELKDELIQRGASPKEIENILNVIKERGNEILSFTDLTYDIRIVYIECE